MELSGGLCRILLFGAIASASLLLRAEGEITLATGERPPYIGANLPEQGYVAEVAREALAREGYRLRLVFFPWARAELEAEQAHTDGILRSASDDEPFMSPALIYSDPIPGGVTGLLKKKTLVVPAATGEAKDARSLLRTLGAYRFGVVRGETALPGFATHSGITQQETTDDLQNLDFLDQGSVQLAVVDRLTAADLMVSQRPQLIGRLEFLHTPLAHTPFYVALSIRKPDHAQWLAAFDAGLAALAQDGTLERILNRHGVFPPRQQATRKTRLTIGTVDNHDMVVMRELSKRFEQAHPDIELDWRVLDENTLRLRLMSDVAISDGQFDVMTVGTFEVPIWAKQGWIVPMTHLPAHYDVGDLLPTVRTALSYDRDLYALPFYGESSMTYYRADLFRQAGLTMPAQPSYDQITDFAARLHDPANGIYGICLRGKPGWGQNMALIGTMVDAYGGRWFDERWQAQIDGPEWHAAVGRYLDLLKRFGPPHAEQNSFNENLKLFADGHCAMWIDATVAAGTLFDPRQSRVANDLAYVAAPVAKTTRGTAWLWSWALAIPSSSSHQRAAQAFVTWATSKDYVAQVAKRYGWIAVPPGTRRSTYASPGYRKAAPFGQFVEQAINSADLQTATLEPKPYIGIQYVGIPEFFAIGNEVGEEIARALRGEQTADQALKRAQLLTVEQMKAAGYGQ